MRESDCGGDDLLSLIRSLAVLRGEFKLSGGGTSNIYLDLRRVTLHPRGLALATLALGSLADSIENDTGALDAVAGPTLGADPLVAGMVLRRALLPESIRKHWIGLLIRKESKEHGTRSRLEGPPLPVGRRAPRVLLVEDTVTSGKSLLSAAEAVREAGGVVEHALVLVDREQGAEAALLGAGIRLYPVYRLSDLGLDKEKP